MEKGAKNNERTIIFEDEDDDLFVMKGFFDDPHYKSIYESIIKERPIVIEKAELPDTKETWQEIASTLASLIVLDCEKKR